MKKGITIIVYILLLYKSFGQTITQKLEKAYRVFEHDEQLKHAISSLYVIDAVTGKILFENNSQVGLAPASTQKIITAATAFGLLGKEYRYKTEFFYKGQVNDSLLTGEIYIKGNGDPTFGSWRYEETKPNVINMKFVKALHHQKIYLYSGSLIGINDKWQNNTVPDGWIWQDIGNYYGATASALTWNENQYDMTLKPAKKQGDSVNLVRTEPKVFYQFINELKSGAKNSGDNGYIYFEPGSSINRIRGTVPCCVDSFIISGSVPDGDYFTLSNFADVLNENRFKEDSASFHLAVTNQPVTSAASITFCTHYSPSLDSIIYWLLKKSINLYGEALVKTLAYEKNGYGSTDKGINMVKDFWKQKGIDVNELNLYDGSGLSPLNRVTTHAQVEILKYARKQNWFKYFYDALPEYNGMKMKSGTISDVKGFCGYHASKDGREYIFSFLVNNYSGSSLSLVNKMYKVLDILK